MTKNLKVERRTERGKYGAFALRKRGIIPGILYGKKIEPMKISIVEKDLITTLHRGDRIFDIEIEGQTQTVLLKDLQYEPVGHRILHVDFAAIQADTKIQLDVPIEIKGDAIGQSRGGIVSQHLFTVGVECFPKDLPEKIVLDISDLDIDQVRYVRDLPRLPGVVYTTNESTDVVGCHIPKEKIEVETGVAETVAEPEVIGEKEREEKKKSEE